MWRIETKVGEQEGEAVVRTERNGPPGGTADLSLSLEEFVESYMAV